MTSNDVTHLIIGAGPAGLAAARAFARDAAASILLVDAGAPAAERRHDDAGDIAAGVGGAGLFSDGKFSYFPAGTDLWRHPYHLLVPAFRDAVEMLAPYSDAPLEAPSEEEIADYYFDLALQRWQLKRYPTVYLSLAQRRDLISRMADFAALRAANVTLRTRTTVVGFEAPGVALLRGENGERSVVRAGTVVFAGGRFAPLSILGAERLGAAPRFRRYEFGFRIEAPAANEAMVGDDVYRDVADPKFRFKEDATLEFRTFCWCRNGEVACSRYEVARDAAPPLVVESMSGRSDVAPTQRSNFGFLVRVTARSAQLAALFAFYLTVGPFSLDLDALLGGRARIDARARTRLGDELYEGLVEPYFHPALAALGARFPQLLGCGAQVHGPSIEGLGDYPDHDPTTLELRDAHGAPVANHYVIGDAGGTYRGIVPCLVAGALLPRLVAQRAQRRIVYVSTNEHKRREFEQILGPIDMWAPRAPIVEIQGSTREIAERKCRRAVRALRREAPERARAYTHLFVEDTSLEFEALGGMPGPYGKAFLEAGGVAVLVRMLDCCHNKRATARATVAICALAADADADDARVHVHVFEGTCDGDVREPRGANGFDWDCIFVPRDQPAADGARLSFADMAPELKNKTSHRVRAARHVAHHVFGSAL